MNENDIDLADELENGFIVDDEPQEEVQEVPQSDNEAVSSTNAWTYHDLISAHISVLTSSLGGVEPNGRYRAGHDAIAVLKDIKRWIKSVDEAKGTFDVALACAHTGLVTQELMVMLCQWDEDCHRKVPITNARTTERLMVGCLEILVLLTWPPHLAKDSTDPSRLQYPLVKKAQLIYKKSILSYRRGRTLKAVIRLVLPIIAKPRINRDSRESAIVNLVILLIRNVLAISSISPTISVSKGVNETDSLPPDVSAEDIGHTAIIATFEHNRVFQFLLTIASDVGKDLDREVYGSPLLNCLNLLIKGLDPAGIATAGTSNASAHLPSISATNSMNLAELLAKEAQLKRTQRQHLSTRHGRFGTMVQVRQQNASYVIKGTRALRDTTTSLHQIDASKRWRTPSNFNYDADEYITPASAITINDSAIASFKKFIDQLLASGGLNNVMEQVASVYSGAVDIEVDEHDKAAYFVTLAWFFEYQRTRIQLGSASDYGPIGAGLSEVTFILMIGFFRESFENKRWSALHAAMVCFNELVIIATAIFLQPQSSSPQDDFDRELAEGIIRKLFGFHDFLQILVHIPRTAAKHSPHYLRVAIAMVHGILRGFEAFANENVKLYVQHKRQKRHKRRATNLDHGTENMMRDLIDAEIEDENFDEELEERASEVTRERQLDYTATERRFFHSGVVSAHVEFLSRFQELKFDEIKWCLKYFHRIFVGKKDHGALYRLDLMQILYDIQEWLPNSHPLRNTVDEFVYYFMKKLKSALSRFPVPIELLFNRLEDTESKIFLDSGNLDARATKGTRPPQLARPLEFTREFDLESRIHILMDILTQQGHVGFLDWFAEKIKGIIGVRTFENDPYNGINAPSDTMIEVDTKNQRLILANSHIRTLVEVVGISPPMFMEDKCLLSSAITNEHLSLCLDFLNKFRHSSTKFDDNQDSAVFLRVKDDENDEDYHADGIDAALDASILKGANTQAFDSLSEMGSQNDSQDGKTRKRKVRSSERPLKKKSKRFNEHRQSRHIPSVLDEESQRIKSSEFVRDSDDDTDDDFFDREDSLRRMLHETGGIINQDQLQQFRKAWSGLLERRKGDNRLMDAVALVEKHGLKASGPLTSPSKSDENISSEDKSLSDINHELTDDRINDLDLHATSKRQGRRKKVIVDSDDDA
ncbi:hypothetical protein DIURU_001726 [Diutina rugosa]|uniref:Topoisomerase 1-associated factor 1 n=1 Tax=Diutina rugosa TaxID=5481 RepID=A0A642V0H4_DIURU|nr:uncharacterized protein DIURU_001726 [Diutina rugosa]KAA8905298.1 hypothetical protein DIURU_001726 [Diutina rugosa]